MSDLIKSRTKRLFYRNKYREFLYKYAKKKGLSDKDAEAYAEQISRELANMSAKETYRAIRDSNIEILSSKIS